MALTKPFKTYAQQVELLQERGMHVENPVEAQTFLERYNYYRLSGYWYPMREFDDETGKARDVFIDGASFDLVIDLYRFDEDLRHALFFEVGQLETAFRTMLGHELGRLDPLIHLDATKLGAVAQHQKQKGSTRHSDWLANYKRSLRKSKEDFVRHHNEKYDGEMPIWAAVEIMDWGMLSHLYAMSPDIVKSDIAERCTLSAPQLGSWMKSLNILRNLAAHHARMFNRVYAIEPKLSSDPRLVNLASVMNRTFGQLSLVQYLLRELKLSEATRLPMILRSYPHNPLVPFSRTGAPQNWDTLELWTVL